MFYVDGRLVNHQGKEIGQDGKVLADKGALDSASAESLREQLDQMTADRNRLQERVNELEGVQSGADNGDPSSSDTRTNAELKAALDEKGIQYDSRLNKSGLQALAAEHGA